MVSLFGGYSKYICPHIYHYVYHVLFEFHHISNLFLLILLYNVFLYVMIDGYAK